MDYTLWMLWYEIHIQYIYCIYIYIIYYISCLLVSRNGISDTVSIVLVFGMFLNKVLFSPHC